MAAKPKAAKSKGVPKETYKCSSNIDIDAFTENNLFNHVAESEVGQSSKDSACWLGIDEAGRGPVLGPMVYGIAYSPLENKDDLKEMGFADSKTLSEEQRDRMFDELNSKPDKIGWMVHLLSPHYISTCMLRRMKYNLNELSHDTAIGLIRSVLEKGVNVKEVYVDTVGDPEKYQNKLKQLFPQLEITVAKKADATYSIVSAASICAKVARDKAVQSWRFTETVQSAEECGSGYPGDPKTKDFLNKNVDRVFGFPKNVRFSWSTASKLLEEKAAAVKWADEDEAEEEKSKKRKKSMNSFFETETKPILPKSAKYFTERKLMNTISL